MRELGDEMMRCWQEGQPGGGGRGPDPAELARTMALRVAVFDRKVFWRNFAEYAAGAALMATGVWGAWHGDARSVAVVVCVSFVLSYLWWSNRSVPALDPAADARSYQRAMLDRIDRQIRLLRSVRYWYLLPLTIPMVWQVAETWSKSPGAAVMVLAVVGALFWFIGWLNEVAAVRKLQAERARLVEVLDPIQ